MDLEARCTCLLTCEHASNAVPKPLQDLFSNKQVLLESHHGYDIGAKEYATAVSSATRWPLFCGSYTRLLVDLNRTRRLFSPLIKGIGSKQKNEIVEAYYQPFRSQVLDFVRKHIASGECVIHLSCHTFTPVLNGNVRTMDLSILYDPSRECEKEIAEEVIHGLQETTSMRIRANAPYKGISDGHVRALRKEFPKGSYIGLEIEVSQSLFCRPRSELWRVVWLPRLIEVLARICVREKCR